MWQEPKTDWTAGDVVSKDDFNRIEGNIEELDNIKVNKEVGKSLMTDTERTKLAGIEEGANKYIHPDTHPASMIVETSSKRFVSDVEKANWNSKETPEGAQAKVDAVQANLDEHKADGASHSKTARFVIGTSTAGWTLEDCDYLCDGTNDQEEIIQALNDLPATGGEVVILDGTYNITASINIPKDNVSIRGSGNATTLKRMYNSTDTGGLITLNEKSGCKIQGLQIDGNKATYTASYNYGIYLSSSNNNTVTGNTCNSNYNGIYLSSSSSDNTVTGNTCNNNYNYGIRLYPSSNNNTITGNTCNNNYNYGIYLSSSSDNTVTGNTCNNNYYNGIYLYSSSNNTITGNTCNSNYDGISLDSSSNNNTITGNTCNNNNYGICLYPSSNNNTITGNTCIRGTGLPTDYDENQYTIRLVGANNNYNLISNNNCMGKAVVVGGGMGNSAWGNKYDSGNDLP